MVNILMESPSLLGRQAKLLSETLSVQTLLRCPMWHWEWEAGALATLKESKKDEELAWTHHVAPLAIETSIVFGPGTQEFVSELGRRLIWVLGNILTRSHMIQKISVTVHRGNGASVLGTFEHCNSLDNYNYNCSHC